MKHAIDSKEVSPSHLVYCSSRPIVISVSFPALFAYKVLLKTSTLQ